MTKRRSRKDLFILFGKRLRALRLKKGLTSSQFSRATGIDAAVLRKYEAGELEPGLVVIMSMARALGISHLELLDQLDIEGDNFL